MSKYAVAFIAPTKKMQLIHKIVEGENKEAALRVFFNENASEFYSDDEKGFLYFKEDFYDEGTAAGNLIDIT